MQAVGAQPHYDEITEGPAQAGGPNYEAPSALHESEYAVGLHDSASPARTAARRAALAEALARDAARSGGVSVNPTDQAYAALGPSASLYGSGTAAFSGSADYEVRAKPGGGSGRLSGGVAFLAGGVAIEIVAK